MLNRWGCRLRCPTLLHNKRGLLREFQRETKLLQKVKIMRARVLLRRRRINRVVSLVRSLDTTLMIVHCLSLTFVSPFIMQY
jgi:hypothetical protein